ncbi:XRE family transcriptional regulator [Sphaerisporangium album]|uniref:XRE family transcriptional regulator n=1 Tax=Sphaerisporangium album TaxID=509200 RepID=A0A367FG55_9ACTN|nr:helix-turn-helix transcriptional regulator [Sphaerisporangium album]RCG28889.1 XRE family transcriptional regulator [Sphaerisporangium album]
MYERVAPVNQGKHEQKGIGPRIAELRALRGYSLRDLGKRAHVSPSMLSRIESGDRHPSEPILAAVARAMGVDMSTLRGQPYIHMLQKDQLDTLLAPIAVALDGWDVHPLEDDPPPRPLPVLETELRGLIEKRAQGRFVEIGKDLPALIAEANHLVLLHDPPGRDRERAHWILSEVCRTVYVVTHRIGFNDLARLGLSRMAAAAAQSGDPREVAIERWNRAQLMADAARHDRGVRLVEQALRDLDDDGEVATQAVRGALHLKAAVLTGRQGDPDGAEDWLGEATRIAEQTGETPAYEVVFGPTNCLIHGMAMASDRDRHGKALERAAKVRMPNGYPAARAGHYWVDRARAEVWTARHAEAMESLETARHVAPDQTRYHPSVHETVAA